MIIEQFKKIEGFPNYSISNMGQVRNDKNNTIMKPYTERKGYIAIKLSNKGKRKGFKVHRLVALHFIDNPENKPEVNHLAGKQKDHNWLTNLEWSTGAENIKHGWETGLHQPRKGELGASCKLSDEDVLKIVADNRPQHKIAKDFGVTQSTISMYKTGQLRSELTKIKYQRKRP